MKYIVDYVRYNDPAKSYEDHLRDTKEYHEAVDHLARRRGVSISDDPAAESPIPQGTVDITITSQSHKAEPGSLEMEKNLAELTRANSDCAATMNRDGDKGEIYRGVVAACRLNRTTFLHADIDIRKRLIREWLKARDAAVLTAMEATAAVLERALGLDDVFDEEKRRPLVTSYLKSVKSRVRMLEIFRDEGFEAYASNLRKELSDE